MNCIKCGEKIIDPGHLKEVLGYKHDPKYCEKCRRVLRNYRNKTEIQRQEIARWDNCTFKNFPFKPESLTQDGRYDIYAIGGRRWGEWGGVCHSGKILCFVNINHEPEHPCLIRKMKKNWIKNNGEEIIKGENDYIVIDPEIETERPMQYVYYFCDYYKTTLKGFGRDRNLKHIVSGEYDVIINGHSSARSGRFGNRWQLIVGKNIEIERKGVA